MRKRLIRRYERCWILSLPAWGRKKLEIVFAPSEYGIREHTHPNQDIKLILLFGHNVIFHRRKFGEFFGQTYMACMFRDFLKKFTINAGDSHWFEVSNWPLIFLNIETWHTEPTSAAEDLKYTDYAKT
jgi:hypothetical protein